MTKKHVETCELRMLGADDPMASCTCRGSRPANAYPVRIYLQRHEDCVEMECEELHEGTTWCSDRINETDVEYVRADLAGSASEPRRNPLREALEQIVALHDRVDLVEAQEIASNALNREVPRT